MSESGTGMPWRSLGPRAGDLKFCTESGDHLFMADVEVNGTCSLGTCNASTLLEGLRTMTGIHAVSTLQSSVRT